MFEIQDIFSYRERERESNRARPSSIAVYAKGHVLYLLIYFTPVSNSILINYRPKNGAS